MNQQQRVEQKRKEMKMKWREVKVSWQRFKDITNINVLGLFIGVLTATALLRITSLTSDWTWDFTLIFIFGSVVAGAFFTAIISWLYLPNKR